MCGILRVALVSTALLILPVSEALSSDDDRTAWPQRVLLTNDDGIEEGRLWALARAFSRDTETFVVASYQDRSGSSNYSRLGKYQRTLLARREHVEENLIAYGIAGYPTDAVFLGVGGLFADTPPDLVVSGVNGGHNLGADGWWGSGTIGAARAAAFLGIPAIAVSGLDDDDSEMVARVSEWVVRFARSPVVRNLEPGQYLTVAFPQIPADQVQGVRIAPRMPSVIAPTLERVFHEEDGDQTEEVWLVNLGIDLSRVPADSDGALLQQGYVVITPMSLGEVDLAALATLESRAEEIPTWSTQ